MPCWKYMNARHPQTSPTYLPLLLAQKEEKDQPTPYIEMTLEITLLYLTHSWSCHSVLFKIKMIQEIMHIMNIYFLAQFLICSTCCMVLLKFSSVIKGLFLGMQIWNLLSPAVPLQSGVSTQCFSRKCERNVFFYPNWLPSLS